MALYGKSISDVEIEFFLLGVAVYTEGDIDPNGPLHTYFLRCEAFEDHVTWFQVTVVHPHFLEVFKIENILCCTSDNQDLLHSTFVQSFSHHSNLENYGRNFGLFFQDEVSFREGYRLLEAHLEVGLLARFVQVIDLLLDLFN